MVSIKSSQPGRSDDLTLPLVITQLVKTVSVRCMQGLVKTHASVTVLMSTPTPTVVLAVDELSGILDELRVTYAILGGAACQVLGSSPINCSCSSGHE